METQKSVIDYDLELFDEFQSSFSSKYPELFENQKLYNSRGRKCHLILKSLKKIILQKEKNIEVKKAINTLLELLSEKGQNTGLCYLSSFDYDLFANYKSEILESKEWDIWVYFWIHNESKKNTEYSFTELIHEAFKLIFEIFAWYCWIFPW